MWIDLSFSCLQISSLQLEKAYTLSSQTFAEYVFAQIRWPCWVDTRHFLCNFPLRWERHLAAVSLIFQGSLQNRYGMPNWEWPMRSMSMFDSCCSFIWNSNLFFFCLHLSRLSQFVPSASVFHSFLPPLSNPSNLSNLRTFILGVSTTFCCALHPCACFTQVELKRMRKVPLLVSVQCAVCMWNSLLERWTVRNDIPAIGLHSSTESWPLGSFHFTDTHELPFATVLLALWGSIQIHFPLCGTMLWLKGDTCNILQHATFNVVQTAEGAGTCTDRVRKASSRVRRMSTLHIARNSESRWKQPVKILNL